MPLTQESLSGTAKRLDSRGSVNPPHPFALVAAMRSIGYTTPTALADLVDNSITAEAKLVRIRVAPPKGTNDTGFVSVEDDGKGMSAARLFEAMRWGGNGPNQARRPDDLGRFGLGMKTASLSIGRTMTVASRSVPGEPLAVLRWDLGHVESAGWELLGGADEKAAAVISDSSLADAHRCGTIVVVTQLDRLSVRSGHVAHAEKNEATLIRKVARHLGMVFHRFISEGVVIKLGSSAVAAWDPFEDADLKDEESLGDKVSVASFVLPHHSRITREQDERMAGPLGWTAHQGFLIYRARRLIVPGGWLRLFSPEEACRLARIRVDLPNAVDDGWNLNVMKSSVVPPSWVNADLQRIGEATRRHARAVFNFRGERQAPSASGDHCSEPKAFWNQVPTEDAVRFRINRAHPIVQTLKQNLREPGAAEQFLKTFERLLPLDAILQDPKRTTNGAAAELEADELRDLIALAKKSVRVLQAQGRNRADAIRIVLSVEPFAFHRPKLEPHLS